MPAGLPTQQPALMRFAAAIGVVMPASLLLGFALGFGGNLLGGALPSLKQEALAVCGVVLILVGVAAAFVGVLLIPYLRCAACTEKLLWTREKSKYDQPYPTYGFGGGVALSVNVWRGGLFVCPHCGTPNHLPH